MENASEAQVEFRGRLVAHDYPERHAAAQQVTAHADFADDVPRDRLRYSDPKDRYPGGITYSTREERARQLTNLADADIEGRTRVDKIFPHKDDPSDLIGDDEQFQTAQRCADCDVDVGEFHLIGCDLEVCPGCNGQSISCSCRNNEETDDEPQETSRFYDLLQRFWWGLCQLWWHVRYGRPRKIVIYAREYGSDSNGKGTFDRPYKTFRRAVSAIPSFIPPNRQFTIDITGVGVEYIPNNWDPLQRT